MGSLTQILDDWLPIQKIVPPDNTKNLSDIIYDSHSNFIYSLILPQILNQILPQKLLFCNLNSTFLTHIHLRY